jgi:flagellar hook-associated protein 1 FlgK
MCTAASVWPKNPLLDQRDALLGELSSLIQTDVQMDEKGRATVRIGPDGSGGTLVSGGVAAVLELDATQGLSLRGPQPPAISVQASVAGGSLGALADAAGAIEQAQSDFDSWAAQLAGQMNTVHAAGITADGTPGADMFALTGWQAENGVLTRGEAAISVSVISPADMPTGPLTLIYDAGPAEWMALDGAGTVLGQGADTISLPGMDISVTGSALDGDRVTLTRRDDDASTFRLVLTDIDQIAAGQSLTVSAAASNTGTAQASVRAVAAPNPDLTGLDDLMDGDTFEFLTSGVVGYIPAQADTALLAALPRLATLEITVPDGANPESLKITTALADPLEFPIPAGMDLSSLADALNTGAVLSLTGAGLADLGLVAFAENGVLALSARDGAMLPDSVSLVTSVGDAVGQVVMDAADAADIAVFTRDGRQLSGPPLSPQEAAALLTPENGFFPEAEYSADYLSGAQPYGGLTLNSLSPAGDFRVILGRSGGMTTWGQGETASPSVGATIGFQSGDQAISVTLPDGASAAWQAQELTQAFGIGVTAETRLALDLPQSGLVSFGLTGTNLTATQISADLGGGPAALAQAINAQTHLTGITAQLSVDGTRLELVQDGGADIILTSVTLADGGAVGVTRLSPDHGVLEAAILGAGGADSVRISGTVALNAGYAFALTENGTYLAGVQDGTTNGLIAAESAAAGSRLTLFFAESAATDTTLRQISVISSDGRAHVAVADPVLGGSSTELAADMLIGLREQAPSSVLTGAALSSLPPSGAQMSVSLGDQDYVIRMIGDTPTIAGGEPGRLTAYFDAENRLVLETNGGDLDGAALSLPPDTGEAARFGMGVADAPVTTIIGQPLVDTNLSASFAVTVDGVEYTLGIAAGVIDVPPAFPGAARINTETGRIEIQIDGRAGDFRIAPQKSAAEAGFDTMGLTAVLSGDGLILTATDGRVLQLDTVSGGSGATVYLEGLPQEELLVVMSGDGAARLAGQITDGQSTPRPQEVRVLDADTGLVGLFDTETGAHLASRVLGLAGVAQFGAIQVSITGTAQTGDRFIIASNPENDGDARTITALSDLRQRDALTGMGGYGAGFASLQQRVGAQVAAAQSRVTSTQAVQSSAAQAETALVGVDLDAEAAQLMQQQQAYQANAQVMTVARELFDTLLQAL